MEESVPEKYQQGMNRRKYTVGRKKLFLKIRLIVHQNLRVHLMGKQIFG